MTKLTETELVKISEKIKASVEFFANFETDELIEILKASSLKKVKQGEVIFKESDAGKEMYIVVYGAVEISRGGKLLETSGSSGCFGEMGIIDKSPRAADARAKEDTLLVVIDDEILNSTHVGVRLKLYKNFAVSLAKRLRKTAS